jgi:hypothetical protein
MRFAALITLTAFFLVPAFAGNAEQYAKEKAQYFGHIIPEGSCAIYFQYGQVIPGKIKCTLTAPFGLDGTIWTPGMESYLVKVAEDEDEANDIWVVSKEGVQIRFPRVRIANIIAKDKVESTISRFTRRFDDKLVTDPIGHYLRELCTGWTAEEIEISRFGELNELILNFIQQRNKELDTGITINWVRIDPPIVPDALRKKRQELAEERAEKLVMQERNQRMQVAKDGEIAAARRDGEIALQRAADANQKALQDAQARQEQNKIEMEILVATANARLEATRLEAEGLRLLTQNPQMAELQLRRALPATTTAFIGAPSMTTHLHVNGDQQKAAATTSQGA